MNQLNVLAPFFNTQQHPHYTIANIGKNLLTSCKMRSKQFLSLTVRDFICLRNAAFINVLHMHDEVLNIFTI